MPHPETGPNSSERAGDQGSEGASDKENSESDSGSASEGDPEEELLRRELGRSEGRFELLVQEVKEYAIFRMDPGGYIQSWNKGAERIKGYTEEEIL